MTSSPESEHLEQNPPQHAAPDLPAPGQPQHRVARGHLAAGAIGTVDVDHDGQVAVRVGSESALFTHPDGKDIDEQMVIDLRRLLSKAGYEPS